MPFSVQPFSLTEIEKKHMLEYSFADWGTREAGKSYKSIFEILSPGGERWTVHGSPGDVYTVNCNNEVRVLEIFGMNFTVHGYRDCQYTLLVMAGTGINVSDAIRMGTGSSGGKSTIAEEPEKIK